MTQIQILRGLLHKKCITGDTYSDINLIFPTISQQISTKDSHNIPTLDTSPVKLEWKEVHPLTRVQWSTPLAQGRLYCTVSNNLFTVKANVFSWPLQSVLLVYLQNVIFISLRARFHCGKCCKTCSGHTCYFSVVLVPQYFSFYFNKC